MRVFSEGVDKHFFIFRDGLSEEQIYYVRPRHTSDHVTNETSTDVMFWASSQTADLQSTFIVEAKLKINKTFFIIMVQDKR